jgi:hypothetical protein
MDTHWSNPYSDERHMVGKDVGVGTAVRGVKMCIWLPIWASYVSVQGPLQLSVGKRAGPRV